MMREKGKAKAHALYDRAQVLHRSGSPGISSACYRRHAFIDQDGLQHNPEHCSLRMATRPQTHYHDDSNPNSDSDSDSDSGSDNNVTDDGFSFASQHFANCCFQHRQRVGSIASSSLSWASADYPPPTSSLHPPHLAYSHRPHVPFRERPHLPASHRPSLALPTTLFPHPPQHQFRGGVPLTCANFSHPLSRTYYAPRIVSIAPNPTLSSPPVSPPCAIIPIPGDGLEHMPLTRQYLESGTVMVEPPNVKPITGFRRGYQSLKLDWNIGLMRTRKKFCKVFKMRQQ